MPEIAKGFEDVAYRKQIAGELVAMIEAYDASVCEPFETYELASDVYDDKETMSSLEFLEDYDPYNLPLLKIRVKGLVQNVCGGFSSATPYFIVKNGNEEYEREAAEKDLQYALEQAKFDLKIRLMGKEAGLKARGPVRVTFQEIKPGEANGGQSAADGPLSYVGIVMDPIPAERALFYPSNAGAIGNCEMVGHWFEEIAAVVRDKQLDGEYIDDWNPIGTDDTGITDGTNTKTQVSRPEHASLRNYSLYVKLRPKQGDISEIEGEPTKSSPKRRWYHVVLCRSSQEILKIEDYEDPWPPIFAPCFEDEIEEIWPVHSIASSLLELSAIVNDQLSLGIFGGAQAAFLTVLAAGFVTDAQTMKIGIGRLIGFKGDPKFYPIPNNFNPSTIEGIAKTAERYADGISQQSQVAQGQSLPKDATATEVEALVGGTIAGTQEQRVYFSDELVRMAQFCLYLLGKHFKAWKRFHKKSIRATGAKCYKDRYSLEINGKAPGNTSQSIVSKVKMLIEAIKELEMPVTQPQQPIDVEALFEVIVNALDLPISTEKLRPVQDAQPTENPYPEEAGVPPFPVAEYSPQAIPNELLAQLLAAEQMGLPPEVLAQAIGGGAAPLGDPGLGPIADGVPAGAY